MAEHTELFKKFGKAFMKKDVATVGECLSDDFVWALPTGEVYEGKPAALAAMQARFDSPGGPVFSDSHFAFHGDTIVQNYRVTVTLPSGEERQLPGMDVYYVTNGLISRKDAYWKQIQGA